MSPWPKGVPRKPQAHHDRDELEYLRDLVAWMGPWLRVRAASMAMMTKKCRLCLGTKLRSEQCRHGEVWAVAARVDEGRELPNDETNEMRES